VESPFKLGNEPSGSIKCWELPSGCTTCGLSSGTHLHSVSYSLEYKASMENLYGTQHLYIFRTFPLETIYCLVIRCGE
jgi:hypothetical protein